MPSNNIDTLVLSPLSAGDLLDRIVRLYRLHWIALMRIVGVPVILTYISTMAITLGIRNFSTSQGDLRIGLSILLILGGVGLYAVSKATLLLLLGGTAEGLVQYFMNGSPLTVRTVYQSVRANFWRLLGAVFFAVMMLLMLFFMLYFVLAIGGSIYILSAVWLLTGLPTWIQVALHIIFGSAAFLIVAILALMMLKRAVFLPQIIAVEKKTVSAALTRCFSLAGHEFKLKDSLPIGALTFFYIYISWSVLLLFLIPVSVFAWMNGVELGPFSLQQPLWYTVLTNTISQASEILITPVMLLGFILLYLDSRVRREGYDLELLANRYLPSDVVVIPHGSFPMEVPKPEIIEDYDHFNSDSNLTVLSLR